MKLGVIQKAKKKGKTVVTVSRELTPLEKVKNMNKPVASMNQAEKDELLELLKQHLLENTK